MTLFPNHDREGVADFEAVQGGRMHRTSTDQGPLPDGRGSDKIDRLFRKERMTRVER